jgi:LETM1-like, RBD
MNPSTSGWIHKFINEFSNQLLLDNYASSIVFYEPLKNTGFIYGVSIKTLLDEPISHLKLTRDELTKVNLFHSLWFTFFSEKPKGTHKEAIDSIVSFYRSIERGKRSFLQKLSFTSSSSENLEKIISARLHETNNMLKKDATMLLTHALLYIDVLAFAYFLKKPDGLKVYLDVLEKTLIEHSIRALQSKKEKNKYDHLVIELVTSSSEFMAATRLSISNVENVTGSMGSLEKQFILDICCLAVWDDRELDENELEFLKSLGKRLGYSEEYHQKSIESLMQFSESNAQKIQLFEYSHPVKQFYRQSTKMVKLLILRNKKRLLIELNESGELLVLLGQSTQRDLTSEEKGKVKEQLLDIFKTVPSLTIFLIPGGTLLLPLFVKLIPKLLPSAFQENRIDEAKK